MQLRFVLCHLFFLRARIIASTLSRQSVNLQLLRYDIFPDPDLCRSAAGILLVFADNVGRFYDYLRTAQHTTALLGTLCRGSLTHILMIIVRLSLLHCHEDQTTTSNNNNSKIALRNQVLWRQNSSK